MKQLLILTFIFACVALSAISQSGLLFLSFEPSSINRAMGGGVTGVVNIWHNNPLTVYTNPAVSAFHEGLAYGYSKDKWGDIPELNDMYYNSSMLTYGYKGVGIMLPGYNASDKFGITFDAGTQEYPDSKGEVVGEYSSYDHATTFGFALNPCENYRSLAASKPAWLEYVDLAIGANYIDVHSDLGHGFGVTEQDAKADTRSLNIGGIARLNYCYDRMIGVEAVYGITHFNVEDNEITYVESEQVDPVWQSRNQGFAFGLSVKAEKLAAMIIPEQFRFFDNLLTFRYLNAKLDPLYNTDERTTGSGTEIGLLDTFFIRNGQYDDDAGEINGGTSGYGINLHYRNLVGFSYNYAETPGGGLFPTQKSEDYSVNIDFIKLAELLRN
ncbi:MAG: hypothetical protein RBS43_00975 [Candidatus Cloacimonas sp.]|jgi:hypothetical protein|nr:hypothetical protein [Candidatus Cloacimonas sp.]